MKILLVHNHYQQPGGEDRVFALEHELLTSRGNEVITYERSNSEVLDSSPLEKLALPRTMRWADDSYRQVKDLIRKHRPEVVHVHNTFFRISPAVFFACDELGVPVVQTLHNFRLMCPAAVYFREGRICEKCRESGLWQSVLRGCYRNSRPATAAVAFMLAAHRRAGTWTDKVTCYIALSEFSRRKFVEGGLEADKITVKPNFAADPGPKDTIGDHALFVGRLSSEKGLATLIRAWGREIPLRIIGDGPLLGGLSRMAADAGKPNITFLRRLPHAETITAIKTARFLVVPSENYENFPMTIVEAMACGTPVICSRLGAMQEIVTDNLTGLHFSPGDSDDLAAKVAWAWNHPEEIGDMGRAARRQFEQKYTADQNYAALMSIYERAIVAKSSRALDNQLLEPAVAINS